MSTSASVSEWPFRWVRPTAAATAATAATAVAACVPTASGSCSSERVWVPGELIGYDRHGHAVVTEGFWTVETPPRLGPRASATWFGPPLEAALPWASPSTSPAPNLSPTRVPLGRRGARPIAVGPPLSWGARDQRTRRTAEPWISSAAIRRSPSLAASKSNGVTSVWISPSLASARSSSPSWRVLAVVERSVRSPKSCAS